MLPIALDPSVLKIGLAGQGEGLARRAALLAEAGIEPVAIDPDTVALDGLHMLFVAGLPTARAARLARLARGQGILVNVEDVPALCDFHVPAIIRRGDLTLTVSTGGRVPGLARALRESLAEQFGPEWTLRLKELGAARPKWRSQGLSPREVSQHVRELIVRMGWL